MKKHFAYVLLAGALAGCSSSKPDHAIPPPPAPVAIAPKYSPEPLKPDLHEKARQELLSDTTAADPYLRSNAIEALVDVDPADAPGPVMKGLSDPEISVRFAAIMAAGKIKLVDAYPTLQQMAYDKDLRIQAAVRYALHKLGDKRLTQELERLSMDGDSHVRGGIHGVACGGTHR